MNLNYGYCQREKDYKNGINIRELSEMDHFFQDPLKVPMPNLLRYLIINKLEKIFSPPRELRTEVQSSSQIKKEFPEITEKLPEFFKEQEKYAKGLVKDILFPVAWREITEQISETYIYHPETGKLIGKYKEELPF